MRDDEPTVAGILRRLLATSTGAARMPPDLACLGAAEIHALVADRLRTPWFPLGDRLLVLMLWHALGVGDGCALAALVADRSLAPAVRACALMALLQAAPQRGQAVAKGLGAEEGAAITRERVVTELAMQFADPRLGVGVAQLLFDAPATHRAARLAQLDACRRHAGVPAAIAYAGAISTLELAAEREALLGLVVDEGGLGSRLALEFLWARTSDAGVRAAVGTTLGLVERTGGARSPAREREGAAAYVRDDDGTVHWLVLVRHPEDVGFSGQIDVRPDAVRCAGMAVIPDDPVLRIARPAGSAEGPPDAFGEVTLEVAARDIGQAVRDVVGPRGGGAVSHDLLVAMCLLDGLPARPPAPPTAVMMTD